MESIQKHIERDLEILNNTEISPQSRRHTQDELNSLERYIKRHPDVVKDPSSLELFCDDNPGAIECKSYDL